MTTYSRSRATAAYERPKRTTRKALYFAVSNVVDHYIEDELEDYRSIRDKDNHIYNWLKILRRWRDENRETVFRKRQRRSNGDAP